MAFFSDSIIKKLEETHKENLSEKFCESWNEQIEDELKRLEEYILENKTEIQEALVLSTNFTKTTESLVACTTSYDFSKVGGGDAMYDNYTGLRSYHSYIVSRESMYYSMCSRAKNNYIDSEKTGKITSLYRIWKSKDFLKKLAERLKLPKNAYFAVYSEEVDGEFVTFPDEDIIQYRNRLMLIYRFAK